MLQEMALFIFFVCQLYSANKPDFHDEIDITPVINVEAGIEELKRSFGEFFPKLSFSEKFPKQQKWSLSSAEETAHKNMPFDYWNNAWIQIRHHSIQEKQALTDSLDYVRIIISYFFFLWRQI